MSGSKNSNRWYINKVGELHTVHDGNTENKDDATDGEPAQPLPYF
jgi:hypothetical protein